MWQWRNHGPGLSVCVGNGQILLLLSRLRHRETYHEADSDVVASGASADGITPDGVLVVVLGAVRAADDRERVLRGGRGLRQHGRWRGKEEILTP